MSYILEAIRRSEDERRKRLVPDVTTIHAVRPASAPRSSRWLYGLVAGGGLALGLAGIVWLQARPLDPSPAGPVAEAEAPPAPTGADDQAGDGTSAEQTVIAAAPPRPEAPPPSTSPPAPAAPARPAGDDAMAASEAPPPPAKAAKPRTSRAPYSTPAASSPAPPPKLPARVAALPPGPLINSLPATGAAVGGGEAPLAGLASAAPEFVSAIALRDLPDPVRQSLPDIAISLHRYASSPEARQVRVNGRAVREGDTIGNDISVAEITRGGVVFAVGGQRFYMSAFQNWRAKAGP